MTPDRFAQASLVSKPTTLQPPGLTMGFVCARRQIFASSPRAGDFVGAILIVVTLIYLAVQVRQNTRALHAQSRQAALGTGAYIDEMQWRQEEL